MLSFENKKHNQQLYIHMKTFYIYISLKDDTNKENREKNLKWQKNQ